MRGIFLHSPTRRGAVTPSRGVSRIFHRGASIAMTTPWHQLCGSSVTQARLPANRRVIADRLDSGYARANRSQWKHPARCHRKRHRHQGALSYRGTQATRRPASASVRACRHCAIATQCEIATPYAPPLSSRGPQTHGNPDAACKHRKPFSPAAKALRKSEPAISLPQRHCRIAATLRVSQ